MKYKNSQGSEIKEKIKPWRHTNKCFFSSFYVPTLQLQSSLQTSTYIITTRSLCKCSYNGKHNHDVYLFFSISEPPPTEDLKMFIKKRIPDKTVRCTLGSNALAVSLSKPRSTKIDLTIFGLLFFWIINCMSSSDDDSSDKEYERHNGIDWNNLLRGFVCA